MSMTRFRKSLAPALAVLVVCTLSPAPLFTTYAAGGIAIFTGQVFQPDGVTPRTGATVILVGSTVDQDGRRIEYRSAPTGGAGSFRIEGAPAGPYSLLVDTSEGAFLAAESMVLTAGVNPRQSLTLNSSTASADPGAGQSLAGITWGQWIIAGAIAVAAAVAINEVSDDVEEPASPF